MQRKKEEFEKREHKRTAKKKKMEQSDEKGLVLKQGQE